MQKLLLLFYLLSLCFNIHAQDNFSSNREIIIGRSEELIKSGDFKASVEVLENLNTWDKYAHKLIIQSYNEFYKDSFVYCLAYEKHIEDYLNSYTTSPKQFVDDSHVFKLHYELQNFKLNDSLFAETYKNKKIESDTVLIKETIEQINQYLFLNKISYHQAYLKQIVASYSDSLYLYRKIQREYIKDTTERFLTKKIALFSLLEIHTLLFINSTPTIQSISNEQELLNFLSGTGNLTPAGAYGLSLLNFGINVNRGSHAKLAIIVSPIDLSYMHFNNSDKLFLSTIGNSSVSATSVSRINAYTIGMRLGLMAAFRIQNSVAIAPYYQFKPYVNFIDNELRYTSAETNSAHLVTPNKYKISFGNEVGLRMYFKKNFYLSAFATLNYIRWNNQIFTNVNNLYTSTQSNYLIRTIGLRIGI